MPKQKQHYVPKFYIKGFIPATENKDQLYVFNKETQRSYKSGIDDIACMKNIYTLENHCQDNPHVIEKFFSKHETNWADLFKKMTQNKGLPKNSDLQDQFLNFVAMTIARNPRSLEHLKNNAQSQGVGYSFGKDEQLSVMLQSIEQIKKGLSDHKWMLLQTPDEKHDLICSDTPFFHFKDIYFNNGIESRIENRTLVFPISKTYVAFCDLKDNNEFKSPILNPLQVGYLNHRILTDSSQCFYSGNSHFVITNSEGKLARFTHQMKTKE